MSFILNNNFNLLVEDVFGVLGWKQLKILFVYNSKEYYDLLVIFVGDEEIYNLFVM